MPVRDACCGISQPGGPVPPRSSDCSLLMVDRPLRRETSYYRQVPSRRRSNRTKAQEDCGNRLMHLSASSLDVLCCAARKSAIVLSPPAIVTVTRYATRLQ